MKLKGWVCCPIDRVGFCITKEVLTVGALTTKYEKLVCLIESKASNFRQRLSSTSYIVRRSDKHLSRECFHSLVEQCVYSKSIMGRNSYEESKKYN